MPADATAQAEREAVEQARGPEDLFLDPVTRVAGAGGLALDIRQVPDGDGHEVHSQAQLYRGYETVIEGRDPRDAVDLSSRVCGFSGAIHTLASAMALEMALGIQPPPLAVWMRNVGQTAGAIFSQAGHLFILAGPDYAEATLSRTDPDLVEQAYKTPPGHAGIHGFDTVGDIMAGLDPPAGKLYLMALERSREAREIASLMLGKFPHPSTAAPGGLTTTLSRTGLTQVFSRLRDLVRYAKMFPLIWDDLLDFLLSNKPGFREVGRGPADLISVGCWDDPAVYDARYETMDAWGKARLSTPGAVVDGDLETTDLTRIDAGIEEFVDRSFYDGWASAAPRFEDTPAGDTISPHHPWNKRTLERPTRATWTGPYSWATAPRWEGRPMETGSLARLWITAKAQELDDPFIQPTGDGLDLVLPKADLPKMTLRWQIPDQVNAAERLRARAYSIAHAGLGCYVSLVAALDEMKTGRLEVHTPFDVPGRGTHRGVGLWDDPRGALSHHVVLDGGTLEAYQIVAASTWNASPRGPEDQPGPLERSVQATPWATGTEGASPGIDLVRAARSFDPCMVCAAH